MLRSYVLVLQKVSLWLKSDRNDRISFGKYVRLQVMITKALSHMSHMLFRETVAFNKTFIDLPKNKIT